MKAESRLSSMATGHPGNTRKFHKPRSNDDDCNDKRRARGFATFGPTA
jgi:hypothetical protein